MTAARISSRMLAPMPARPLPRAFSRASARAMTPRAASPRGERAAIAAIAVIAACAPSAACAACAAQPTGRSRRLTQPPFSRLAPTCPRPNPFRCRAAPIATSCRSRRAGWTTMSTAT
ncbi:hypothetical protein V4E86_18755 [Burkholderia pseudomallei]|uniref:hypothetical protein n=1 Tax=Burkholderia pseudomallei TaxID=28450 RepID=UPI00016AA591|nr:hypothetical protein [Burkholderia pseudomallei]ARK98673.1 hypothetical protein BOC43_31515 [Burkholderia pseudomallei]ARL51869.1 hypothetical protein BOC51_19585 [Burkholderia pseudomallei]AYE27168.1 hypothetical protein CNX72_06925 [Burkholderia pseudomallei]MCD4521902.1 hypothetical protein [Burkholderia pseudomallei]MDA0557902.1 hypothetical protein [Burkholderia pseudomallei]